MFEALKATEPDQLLALIGMFLADERSDKVDLGVGVYKDKTGATPVMRAVAEGERRAIAAQSTKTYVGMRGDAAFNDALARLALGEDADLSRVRTTQTPGGCGALRVIADLLAQARPGAALWLSDPTWPNHGPTMAAAGLSLKTYPYLDRATGGFRFDDMMAALAGAEPGDVVLLHGCCHNPSGANPSPDQWRALIEMIVKHGLFPFVDLAYQGFGDGLDEDAAALRMIAETAPEMAAAISCSKNFGVYRDRVGMAMIKGRTGEEADKALSQLFVNARNSYSMPPNHGAAAVREVLLDDELRADWRAELEEMRLRMARLRQGFADALRRHSNSDRFDFLAKQQGMFSLLGLSPDQVVHMREAHGVYMAGDGRINVAGLPDGRLDDVAAKVVATING